MFSAKTSGAIVLSVGVACIIAVICLAIWIVVLVDTVNKDSQSINEISIKISRLSTSLGHSHNTVRNYYPRLFEGASGLLGGASKTAEEHGTNKTKRPTRKSSATGSAGAFPPASVIGVCSPSRTRPGSWAGSV